MSTNSSDLGVEDEERRKERHALLLKVYETAVAEYRFNVQLTWDRTKFFLLLTLSAITAGIGLLRVALDNAALCLFLAAYFALLLRLTWFGGKTQQTGKAYTRHAQLTMMLAQRELGLYRPIEGLESPDLHLALAVTPGQRNLIAAIFNRKERSQKKPDAGSVVKRVDGVFWVLMGIEGLGVVLCLGAALPDDVRNRILEWLSMHFAELRNSALAAFNAMLP